MNAIPMDPFSKDFDNKTKISIGQTFMISSNCICKWLIKETECYDEDDYKYGNFYTYGYGNISQEDEDDILFVVKYIGNGYVQEMLTGETMLLSIDTILLEDDSDDLVTASDYELRLPTKYEDLENYDMYFDFLTVPEYIEALEEYEAITTKSPLICSLWGKSKFKIDDISKTEYLKHSNEERVALMKKYKEKALSSLEETIKNVDSTIQKHSSRITPEMLDMAYLENDIYNFENQGKKR